MSKPPKEPWRFLLFVSGIAAIGLAIFYFYKRMPWLGSGLTALALVFWHFLGRHDETK